MPDRPPPPGFITALNDIERRLRDAERQVLFPDDEDTDLQVFENGNQLGAVDFLDFGPGVQASLIGDRYVRVTATSGAGEFDAVVDSTLLTDDESSTPPMFTKPGAALTYLDGLGFTRAFVLVREGTYTETGNWTNPENVFLIGTPGTGTGTNGPVWNHAGFSGSIAGWTIHNMYVQFGAKSTGFAGLAASWFTAYNTVFDCSSMTGGDAAVLTNSTYCHYDSCTVNRMAQLGAFVWLRDLEVAHTATVAANPQIATNWIRGNMLVAGATGGVARNWQLPIDAVLRIERTDTIRLVSAAGGPSSITFIGSGAVAHKWSLYGGGNNFQVNTTATIGTSSEIELLGIWGTVTTTAMTKLHIDATVQGVLTVAAPTAGDRPNMVTAVCQDTTDITGPAIIDIAMDGGNREVTLRGSSISGSIVARGFVSASGAFINGINLDSSSIAVAAPGGGASGTARPAILDAASAQNVFVWHDRASWPNAVLDSGSGNRFLPEGSAAFSVNGHVIEDEAVALTQRANMNFVGAGVTAADAGGKTVVTIPATATIDGHVIEDEGTPLTQRANMNFVGDSVTVTDAGGKTLVTIAGGGEPGRSWLGI